MQKSRAKDRRAKWTKAGLARGEEAAVVVAEKSRRERRRAVGPTEGRPIPRVLTIGVTVMAEPLFVSARTTMSPLLRRPSCEI